MTYILIDGDETISTTPMDLDDYIFAEVDYHISER